MKKNRLFSLLLAAALCAGLLTPLAAATPSVDGMHIDGKAAILVDTADGEILYEQNAHEKMYPASITKVMTALLTIEAIDEGRFTLEQEITASNTVNDRMISGASTQNIKAGEIMPLKDVLACALIPSANEACNILAETIGGGIEGFVEMMNAKAKELGCEGTNFTNPHGLHDDNHYTTAYDIYLICNEAMKYPLFRELVTSMDYTVPATNMSGERHFWDTNALITSWRVQGYTYEYATGIKTGYTPEAGYCLASAATKGDRSLIAVVLGCTRVEGTTGSEGHTYFSESKRLLQWGFSNFSRQTVMDATKPLLSVPVSLSEQADKVVAEPNGTISATLPNDAVIDDFEKDVESYYETLTAPVEKGMVLGKVTLRYEGKEYGTLDLVAVDSVARSELLYNLDRIEKFFSQTWVKAALLALILLILFLIVRFLVFGGRRRRSRGYGSRGGRGYSGRRRR